MTLRMTFFGLTMTLSAALSSTSAFANGWPNVGSDLPANGLGVKDAAVIVAISDYYKLPDIAGATQNGEDWYRYLVKVRGVPDRKITPLFNDGATKTDILNAVKKASLEVEPGGTLWFIYVGHGGPSKSLDDGLVLGADTQVSVASFQDRGVPQKQILDMIDQGAHEQAVVIFDACFSGTDGSGQNLLPNTQATVPIRRMDATTGRSAIMSASDAVAGPLAGHDRPAFSYLLLGGIRGWADNNGDKQVTINEAFEYAADVLARPSMVSGRRQVPKLSGLKTGVLATGVTEKGPELVDMSQVLGGFGPSPSAIINVPKIDPAAFAGAGGLSGSINIKAEIGLENALNIDEDKTASAERKRQAWCDLSKITDRNPALEAATARCAEYTRFVADQSRIEQSMGPDYETLVDVLGLTRRKPADKIIMLEGFITTYSSYPKREELRAAKIALANMQQGKPPGIYKDEDGDGIILDACPFEAEDFDGVEDDDGCPEETAGEAVGNSFNKAVSGVTGTIDDAGKAVDEAGFHLYLLDFGRFRLDVGAHLGFGLWDEANVVPTKPDQIAFRPMTALTTRFSIGPLETGMTLDWDLSRDLEDGGGYISGHAGGRIFAVGPWTPSFGVDYRNALELASNKPPNLGLYFANTLGIGAGLSARLTYRYGLEDAGGIVPVHAVFFEFNVLALGPEGSALGEILEEIFDICD
jgi:hypothetical protein